MNRLVAISIIAILFLGCTNTEETKPQATGKVRATDDIAIIKVAADKGDPEAQWLYSIELRQGLRIPINRKEAFVFREKAANAGNVFAKAGLASQLSIGDGCLPDPERASQLLNAAVPALEKLAANGNTEAMEMLGTILSGVMKDFSFPKDEPRALKYLLDAAEKGNHKAKLVLAYVYVGKKDRQPSDIDKALVYAQSAFDAGEPRAADLLGKIFLFDKKDNESARSWWVRGWEKGCVDCGYALAQYFFGRKDLVTAADWLTKTAEKGLPIAQAALGEEYLQLTSSKLFKKKDEVLGLTWLQKAADQHQPDAMCDLGKINREGKIVPKNEKKAFDLFSVAAQAGNSGAMAWLSYMYRFGSGTAVDDVLAYAWANLVPPKSTHEAWAKEVRDDIEKRLSKEEKEEAQRLSAGWKLGKDIVRENAPAAIHSTADGSSKKPESGNLTKKVSGTGFFVSSTGHILTVFHVAGRCREIRIAGSSAKVSLVTADKVNDLALLKQEAVVKEVAGFIVDPSKVRQGEDVVSFGFPLNSVLSSGGNLTPGVISALTGLGNNTNQVQITAPIQPGSSGSPVLDKKGRVVGMVSMKMSDAKAMAAVGQIPQNVNFATNVQTIKTFLEANQVPYKSSWRFFSFEKSTADLSDEAKKWTCMVECWN